MKGRFSTVRRSAAAAGISLAMLVAAGTGAHAAGAVSLTNYTASAASQSLHLSLQLPQAVNDILANAGLIDQKNGLTGIDERLSYSTALGQWTSANKAITGKAASQVFYGTLDKLIATVLAADPKALNANSVSVSKPGTTSVMPAQKHAGDEVPSTIRAVDLAGLVHVGIGNQFAKSSALTQTVDSKGIGSLASIEVSLAPLLGNAGLKSNLDALNQTVTNAINTINNGVAGVLSNLGVKAGPAIPAPGDLSTGHVLKIGIMEATSHTGVTKLAHALSSGATELRTAHAENELANVDVLNGLIHVDALRAVADASLDNRAGSAKATPFTQILGLTVGNMKVLDLSTGKITIAGKDITLPDSLNAALNNLVVNIAGVDIEALHNVRDVRPGHAFAQANTLKISVAPAIQDPTSKVSRPLFSLALEAPTSQASVDVNTTQVLGFNTRTGLNDTAYIVVGPLLFAAAVLVRRFALSR